MWIETKLRIRVLTFGRCHRFPKGGVEFDPPVRCERGTHQYIARDFYYTFVVVSPDRLSSLLLGTDVLASGLRYDTTYTLEHNK